MSNQIEGIEKLLTKRTVRTKKERKRYGKSLRKAVPRNVFAGWQSGPGRPDPVELIFGQDEQRVSALVPIRHERMSVSPFTFYRGAALVMASDLSWLPTTGIEVQLCGDAHVSNFGVFLSPERRTIFDINDFDETMRGPWEWDVARLAASIEICGRDRAFSSKQTRKAVLATVRGYREAMRGFAEMGNLEVWYAHADVEKLLKSFGKEASKQSRKSVKQGIKHSQKKNSARAVRKFTEVVDGKLRIVSDPPIIVPIRDIASEVGVTVPEDVDMASAVSVVLQEYEKTLSPERAALVRSYRGVDVAHKVVGVGSVGLRAWVVVLEGADFSDPLVLQVKEAGPSVLERYVGKAPQANHGQRVVEGQHAIQSASDMLLGWTSLPSIDGGTRDYYVRQLWDGKGSVGLDSIKEEQLQMLGRLCGWTLAHAHARTGDRFAIAAYLGKSDEFDEAMADFSVTYADQNDEDYASFIAAIEQ